MLLAPLWYDPCRDRLCGLEEVIRQLEAEVRAWREDRHGHVAQFFGREKPVVFARTPAQALSIAAQTGRHVMAWGNTHPDLPPPDTTRPATPPQAPIRVEDGFLRSRGLGADLVPPLSLVTDDLGLSTRPPIRAWLEDDGMPNHQVA